MGKRNKNQERGQPKQSSQDRPVQKKKTSSGFFLPDGVSLKLLVFWAGAVLMGLEIAGSRVLAPHFGNSVFVWGSLISIFLIALSLGYFVGGRVADRYPSRLLLNSICVVVSLWILGISLFASSVCELVVAAGLGGQSGPLVAAMLLFLPPSVGMGMVSPFAIRLAAQSVKTVGVISGTLYALSTLGSIVGTMMTTFVLIPLIGLSAILKGLGLVMLLAAVLTFPWWKSREGRVGLAAITLLTLASLFWSGPPRTPLGAGEKIVIDVDTPYHHITVIDNELSNSRELRFDRYIESAIQKSPPYTSLSPYTDYFHLAFLAKPNIERALFIGAGGGIGPRTFLTHNRQMQIDLVDIDPKVLEIAHSHFFLDKTPQIRFIAQDGRMFLKTSQQTYDCIILDAFTIGGRIPFHLVTREFLELCRDKMTADGVFVMNINSAIDGPRARIFRSMRQTIESVFPNTYSFAKNYRARGANDSMNIILVANKGAHRIPPEQWTVRAETLQSNSYVKSEHMRQAVKDLLVNLPNASQAPIFTDDYSPIETMPF